jgi:hypothetical protein
MMGDHGDEIHPDAEPVAEPDIVPPADEDEHTHEGTFAAGQEELAHHPERSAVREDFGAGIEELRHTHEGTFAEGQAEVDPHPEDPGARRDFGEGQEEHGHHPGANRGVTEGDEDGAPA